MVSAVFHGPLDATTPDKPILTINSIANNTDTVSRKAEKSSINPVAAPTVTRTPVDWSGIANAIWPPVFGFALLVGLWALVSISTASSIPSPWETFKQAVDVFSDPFYRKGPNDQGVGWNVLMSLERVALGFGLAAVVGIPAGFAIGRFDILSRMFNPLISLLRPVSPLAW